MATIGSVLTKFTGDYLAKTPQKLKIIDAYLTYIFLTGVFQVRICHSPAFGFVIRGEIIFFSSVPLLLLGGHVPLQRVPLRVHLLGGLLHPRRLP